MIITIQYLEDCAELASFSPFAAAEKLKRAFDCLPITHVLMGWNLPAPLLEACRRVIELSGAKLFRWHPLLTGDGVFIPRPDWQVVGLGGEKVAGFQDMAEFTFVCPNHPEVVEKNLDHIQEVAGSGLYQGLFLDRIRWPSPAANLIQDLGCFCQHCQQAALKDGFELSKTRELISRLAASSSGKIALVEALLGGQNEELAREDAALLEHWLGFRERSITRFAAQVSEYVWAAGMEIGLDCFSPGLTRLVGQDLAALSCSADWIKVMTYAHTLGPAGLPFEIRGLMDFLTDEAGMAQSEAMGTISRSLKLPLPANRQKLEREGLNPQALSLEIQKGVRSTTHPVLAGMELVEIAGVAVLNNEQIKQDNLAARSAGAAGLAISWDLWHIPIERLQLISKIWLD
jgi:hypothetical protein